MVLEEVVKVWGGVLKGSGGNKTKLGGRVGMGAEGGLGLRGVTTHKNLATALKQNAKNPKKIVTAPCRETAYISSVAVSPQ